MSTASLASPPSTRAGWFADRPLAATQALTQTRTAVDELSRMAAELRTAVSRFTY